VLTLSGLNNVGLDLLWATIERHRAALTASGAWSERRSAQAVRWMRAMLEDELMQALRRHTPVAARLPALEADVRAGKRTPQSAVGEVMALFRNGQA
jgi:LAO/AO transport system kinase